MTAPAARPRVVLLRGHQANSWHLRPWRHLAGEFDVALLRTGSNWFEAEVPGVDSVPVRTARDVLPKGRIGDALVRVPGDRYLGLRSRLEGSDIVHSQDLGFWFSMQAARYKPALGFKLVLTCWETIPFLDAYRNVRTRPYRREVLDRTDLFLATTERARRCLLLEGAPPDRIRLCPPGADDELFAAASATPAPAEPLVVSPGRLDWHKGHQDVLRAVAALHRGAVDPAGAPVPRVLVIGSGPEEERLRRHAAELRIADRVEFRSDVPYAQMPDVYAGASCLVLASLPEWYWEEQFGMVLVEAMFAGVPILASSSGAIPEVTAGAVPLFAPGDWEGLARLLADGPLRDPARRTDYPTDLLDRYRGRAYADRLGAAYRELLGARS
jgi:glycosyltransferase involved in cell wall biosynthesis